MNDEIKKALGVLKQGGVVLFPADTGWGLGYDAANSNAISKINDNLQYLQVEELVVMLENPALLERYVNEVPDVAWDLIELSTSPLTVLFSGAKNVQSNLIVDGVFIPLRIVNDAFTKKLLQRFRRPLVYVPLKEGNITNDLSAGLMPEELANNVDHLVELPDVTIQFRPAAIIKLWPDGKINIIRK